MRRNILCRGGGGGRSSSKSGVGVLSGPNTLTSLKHSVSIICNRKSDRHRQSTPKFVRDDRATNLLLPGDGNTPSAELLVKAVVGGIEVDALDGGELFNVEDVFAINSPGLQELKKPVQPLMSAKEKKKLMSEDHDAKTNIGFKGWSHLPRFQSFPVDVFENRLISDCIRAEPFGGIFLKQLVNNKLAK